MEAKYEPLRSVTLRFANTAFHVCVRRREGEGNKVGDDFSRLGRMEALAGGAGRQGSSSGTRSKESRGMGIWISALCGRYQATGGPNQGKAPHPHLNFARQQPYANPRNRLGCCWPAWCIRYQILRFSASHQVVESTNCVLLQAPACYFAAWYRTSSFWPRVLQ